MMPRPASLPLLAVLGLLLTLHACVHEPFWPDGSPFVPIDTGGTTGPGDTIVLPPDTLAGHPCDPDTVYFQRDVLPILISNCAMSGCHDAATAQEGIVLASYAQVMASGEVVPGDLDEGDLYEAITENDPDKIMPPPPATPLTGAQIAVIRTWIQQGARDLTCDEGGGCDTTQVTYTTYIRPLMQTYCTGCHSGSSPSGGIGLTTHAEVVAVAATGALYGAMAHETGYAAMPQGGDKLSACRIDQVAAWIRAGTPL